MVELYSDKELDSTLSQTALNGNIKPQETANFEAINDMIFLNQKDEYEHT